MCLSIIVQDNKLAKVKFREIVQRMLIHTYVFKNVVCGNIISGLILAILSNHQNLLLAIILCSVDDCSIRVY